MMDMIRDIKTLKQTIAAWKKAQKSIGLVPTLGFLHEGHQSLIERARQENDFVVVSIFVNPLQFGPNEDFERYPRDEERDRKAAAAAGADMIFMPSQAEMYPGPLHTSVRLGGITERLCGASRPGHFDGVATVVTKLIHLVEPDRAYFGMKDAQQAAVIMTMVHDLNMNVEIVPCPTVRDTDGLALSSRNVYLSEEERRQALSLRRSLSMLEEWIEQGIIHADELETRIRRKIESEPLAAMDYVEILSFPSLEPIVSVSDWTGPDNQWIAAVAVKFGNTRLIDNRIMDRVEAERRRSHV